MQVLHLKRLFRGCRANCTSAGNSTDSATQAELGEAAGKSEVGDPVPGLRGAEGKRARVSSQQQASDSMSSEEAASKQAGSRLGNGGKQALRGDRQAVEVQKVQSGARLR